ncbi:hypothetical protein [Pseudomonas fluorescens]|uniref:hypothetical protein n=1 Tax=Pseudomonas fluorescens TaxID=294 RepID=UPI001240A8F0|nr:hypothetical protein [Pseudomonas fluorescens]VVQ35065.1 hypothetical protein PS947_04328 [Pseudomonas fluorescens]
MNNLEIASRMSFLKWLGQTPESLRILSDYCAELEKGAWAQSFIDCVYQYSWHHTPDMYDKYILFDVIQALKRCNGNYLVFQVPVGEGPCADKAIEQNNEILCRLPVPFEARFLGGNQDEDGYLQWGRPIHAPIAVGREFHWALLDTLLLPLEVGTNSSAKFQMYMNTRGGIARWPYGAEHITVFINCDLIKPCGIGDDGHEALRLASMESIGDCKVGRSPWERWAEEVSLPLTCKDSR